MKKKAWVGILGILILVLASAGFVQAFERIKFAVISDPHISLPEQKGITDGYKLGLKTMMLTESAVAEINKIPDLRFVLVAGDLTNDAEPWNIDVLRRILDSLKVPYFVVLGNHDLSLVPHEKKDQPMSLSKYTVAGAFIGRSGGMVPGMTYYAQEVAKDLVLVSFDTTRAQVFVPEANLNDFGGKMDPGQVVVGQDSQRSVLARQVELGQRVRQGGDIPRLTARLGHDWQGQDAFHVQAHHLGRVSVHKPGRKRLQDGQADLDLRILTAVRTAGHRQAGMPAASHADQQQGA